MGVLPGLPGPREAGLRSGVEFSYKRTSEAEIHFSLDSREVVGTQLQHSILLVLPRGAAGD